MTTATTLSRRAFLGTMGTLAMPLLAPRLVFGASGEAGTTRDVLLCIFLRGGADGLNVIVPFGDPRYYDLRPTLAIAEPGPGADRAIDLDGFFGLHPALAPLAPLYAAGALAPVHAIGSPHLTHSHFDAMDFIERGTPGQKTLFTGWLGRHLETIQSTSSSPFRAVGFGDHVQTSLRGSVPATAFSSIGEFRIYGDGREDGRYHGALAALYGGTSFLDVQAQQTFLAVAQAAGLDPDAYQPENGAQYPDGSWFAWGLRQLAQIIKAALGLEIACLDFGGWDTHEGQGAAQGWMPGLLDELASGLAAFHTDLGARMARITVVTMSEFGRRVDENGTYGTDHGHGSAWLVLGGGINGGRVYGTWPGLGPTQVVEGGDLAVTTDFRSVLGEIVDRRLANPLVTDVFPGLGTPTYPGIAKTG